MTTIVWDPALETGDATIDGQHRRIFGLAAALAEAVESKERDAEAVADCVWQLTDYVVEHFADEEELMASVGYPRLSVHRDLHAHLTGETLRIAARYFNGEDLSADSLAPFVAGWLRDHILDSDMDFVRYRTQRT
ncbi:MAG: hemerythrin family protein [Aeromicrobium sp.]|jgi:hemerythrin|nr:hemerythrin family protein [Aeromicrobium sp.]